MWNLFFLSLASAASFTNPTCAIHNGKLFLSSLHDFNQLAIVPASVSNVQKLSLSYLYDHYACLGLMQEDCDLLVELLLLLSVFHGCENDMPYLDSLGGLVRGLSSDRALTLSRYASLKTQSDGELNGHVLTASLLWSTDHALSPCPLLLSSPCFIAPLITKAIVSEEPKSKPQESSRLEKVEDEAKNRNEAQNDNNDESETEQEDSEVDRQLKNCNNFSFSLNFSKLTLGYKCPAKLINVSGCLVYNGSLHLSKKFKMASGRVSTSLPYYNDPRFFALSFLYGRFDVSLLSDQEMQSLTEWALIVAVFQKAFFHKHAKGQAMSTICRMFNPLKDLIYGQANSTDLKQMVAAYERMRADSPAGMVYLLNEALRLWKTDLGLPVCQSLNGLAARPVKLKVVKKRSAAAGKSASKKKSGIREDESYRVEAVYTRNGSLIFLEDS